MWRQGDVFIAPIDDIPDGASRLSHCVLAEGELTGHSHRVDQPGAAELFERSNQLFLRVLFDAATIVHDEHLPITVARAHHRGAGLLPRLATARVSTTSGCAHAARGC